MHNLALSDIYFSGSPKGPGFCRAFSGYDSSGNFYDFTDYVPDLDYYGFDDTIVSTCVSGL